MEFKDYYALLEVEPSADLKTIKTAYRRLARKYHPDVSTEADAERKFKQMAEAYEVLKDSDRRAEYDLLRQHRDDPRFSGPPPGAGDGHWQHEQGSASDYSDFFESVFGRHASGFQGQTRRHPPRRGQDLEMEVPLFLEETLAGESRTVSFTVPVLDESGRQIDEVKKTLKVKIPAGVTDGERIRLKGQGVAGSQGAANGDLYLVIRLAPHPLFEVDGQNLQIVVPVAPWEAALGATVQVPTLTGKISLTIPPGSQNGQRLRVRGKGLSGKTSSGDLYAILKVVMPAKADEQSAALWRELAEKAAFEPRAAWESAS
ncbi:curved DNA-binding protein [Erwinia sp. MMLR14_017]|uniref:curved DNA-binding protein n=1 Tax=Erwinia sp. MMLR14_017 TaxID=3093842 RepID=UPI002990741D|nr:curved DNA-binding protein [Erwinia sp. MMLR14_017]MDW8845135.1 curved DNA-binding protein [Erwinia sp. MMLR14_017]